MKAEMKRAKGKARDESRASFARDGIAYALKFISTSGYFALQVSLTMVMERTIRWVMPACFVAAPEPSAGAF